MRSTLKQQTIGSVYTPNQVANVLDTIGVEVISETLNDYITFCVFHGNRNTPSFSVSKSSGKFLCFNGACYESGTLLELVKAQKKCNDFEAMRIISSAKKETVVSFRDQLKEALAPPVEFVPFNNDLLTKMKADFWISDEAMAYMHGRHFEDTTLEDYSIGYSEVRDLVVVPMHTDAGVPLGVIGRGIGKDKTFKNSRKLPTSKTLWNMHRARRTGDVVIICEASFDAMRIAQAGYPNVVACLGGNFSPYHKQQLEKYFSTIIIMTDFDDKEKHTYVGCRKCAALGHEKCIGHNPGRALGETIAEKLTNKQIRWAAFDYKEIYPHGAKDAGDMTDAEIRQAIRGAVSNYEYHQWNIEK